MKRIIRHPLSPVFLAATLLLAGCIVSGQFVVVIDWGGFASTSTTLNSKYVDLTSNSTWNDHKDEIQDVIDVKFKVTIKNNESTPATGEVYVSSTQYLTVAAVRAGATRILHGISVPAHDAVTIGFDESATYRENLDALLALVKDGKFYLYGIAENTPFDIEVRPGSQLLVTFSAGK